jgi:hypothetical protein
MNPLYLTEGAVLPLQPGTGSGAVSTAPPGPIQSTKPTKASFSSTPKPGETFSLMLSDAEEKIISDALAHDKHINEDATTCYYLGGIVYSTASNWTLWLNDKTYTNESDISDLKILNVSKDRVNIKSKTTKGKHGVFVKTDQTFCNDTGSVLVGDHRR